MKRLTARRIDNGLAYLVGVRPNEQEVDSPYPNTLRCILDCFQRLAEYEDTGLMPEEINQHHDNWIPVTERLPESGKHVLLCCEIPRSMNRNRYVCDGYYAKAKSIACNLYDECALEYDEEQDEYFLQEGFYEVIKNWDDFSSITIEDTVTHWMPLPQSPKEVVE